MKKDNKNNLEGQKRSFFTLTAILLLLALCTIIALCCSCNVTRVVTTTAEHYHRGDTTVTIMTKTTESYDGSIKRDNIFK